VEIFGALLVGQQELVLVLGGGIYVHACICNTGNGSRATSATIVCYFDAVGLVISAPPKVTSLSEQP